MSGGHRRGASWTPDEGRRLFDLIEAGKPAYRTVAPARGLMRGDAMWLSHWLMSAWNSK
jgi:hypothetical protein